MFVWTARFRPFPAFYPSVPPRNFDYLLAASPALRTKGSVLKKSRLLQLRSITRCTAGLVTVEPTNGPKR